MAKNTFVAEVTLTESSKTEKDFFPVTLKALFLTLTQITLNFKC